MSVCGDMTGSEIIITYMLPRIPRNLNQISVKYQVYKTEVPLSINVRESHVLLVRQFFFTL